MSSAKQVQFSNQACGRRVLHLKDYTHREIEASWYTSDEVQRHRQNVKRVATALNKGATIDEARDSVRGLEFQTETGRRQRQRNRDDSWKAVFEEQKRQKEAGLCCPTSIAKVYSGASYKCEMTARMFGLADELVLSEQNALRDGAHTVLQQKPSRLLSPRPQRVRIAVT